MECSDSTTHLTNKHVQYPWIGKNRFIFWQIHRLKVLFFWLPFFLRKKITLHWLIDQDRYSSKKKQRKFCAYSKKILGLELFCFVIFLASKKNKATKIIIPFLVIIHHNYRFGKGREVIVIFIVVVVVVLVVVDRFFVVVLLFGLF